MASLLAGIVLGALTFGRDPELGEVFEEVRADLIAASGVLDVLVVEYRESVRNGRVVAEVEYRGARGALARSRSRFLEAKPALELINAVSVRRIEEKYRRLQELIDAKAPAGDVVKEASELAILLRGDTSGL